MPRWLFWTIVLGLAGAAAFAYVYWPRVNVVETGRTPEYADLQPREFAAPEARVLEAAKAAAESLPGWTLVGGGSGPTGSYVRANVKSLFILDCEVTATIRRAGGRTRVTVKSQSKPALDLGRNAANVRSFLAELERRLSS
jgi:hypothetical protein